MLHVAMLSCDSSPNEMMIKIKTEEKNIVASRHVHVVFLN